jgi:cysteine desulfurase family protein (TIGR01976 family)
VPNGTRNESGFTNRMAASLRHRFPGVTNGWARFDGPAGTQPVDTVIHAVADWMSSGNNAAAGGPFAAAQACADQLERARTAVGRLLGADPNGVSFGPNMTSMTLSFTRAIAATLKPGDRVVGTMLDHDANVSPWRIACEQSGAEHVLAPFDPHTGRLPVENVTALITESTKWVTLPGASNLLGTIPDHAPIIDAAHAVGARVFIDAVAWAPHKVIDIATLRCDALVTSPYKWYGPHAGVLYVEPDLMASLPLVKIDASSGLGPARFESGMPNFEGIAGIEAAARFLLEEGVTNIETAENEVFEPLLCGLKQIAGVKVFGVADMSGRAPTAAFTIDGITPEEAARSLAAKKIAVWNGHNYALNVVKQLGVEQSGGVIRAGISRYVDHDDVARLLSEVQQLALPAKN